MSVASRLDQIRKKNKRLQEERIEEVYRKVPQIKEIDKKIKSLSYDLFSGKEVEKDLDLLVEKRNKLLKDNKIPKEYMDLTYDCDKCKDQGYIQIEKDGYVYQEECSCRKKIAQGLSYDMSSIRGLLNRQNFENFNSNLYTTQRNPNMHDETPRDNINKIKNKMIEYSNDFPNLDSKGLLFYGPTGTGKTFMCSSIAKRVLDRGFSVLYQTAGDLFDFMVTYSFMFYEGKMENKEKYDFLFDVDLLIIDDLGSEGTNERIKAELFTLINTRMINNKPIIISSNIDLEEIEDIYGSRVFSRIFGEYMIYEFYGNDLRLI